MTEKEKKEEEEPIKVILVGDSGVGKTSLITCTQKKESFIEGAQISTMVCSFIKITLTISDIKYTINLWDTIGQEQFRSLTKIFLNNSKIVIFVFDITDKVSFDGMDYWFDLIEKELGSDIIRGICANKQDLIDEQAIDDEKIEEYAKNKGVDFTFTSSLAPEGFNVFLEKLVEDYIKKYKPEMLINKGKNNKKITIDKNKKQKKKKSFC